MKKPGSKFAFQVHNLQRYDVDPFRTKQFSQPGDELPWPADNSWPEFDLFLNKLLAKVGLYNFPNPVDP
jgi:hypothetical protein